MAVSTIKYVGIVWTRNSSKSCILRVHILQLHSVKQCNLKD